MLQTAVGVTREGIIGPGTLKAVRKAYRASEDVLVSQLSCIRVEFYKRLKHFDTFGRGWTNRINNTHKEAIGWIRTS